MQACPVNLHVYKFQEYFTSLSEHRNSIVNDGMEKKKEKVFWPSGLISILMIKKLKMN